MNARRQMQDVINLDDMGIQLMGKPSLFYLASPYAHPDAAVVEQRVHETGGALAGLLCSGLFVFSPIVHNHPINALMGMGGETQETRWAFWKAFDTTMIDRADGVIVLMLDGWNKSKGVAAEVAYANEQGKRVLWMVPRETYLFSSLEHAELYIAGRDGAMVAIAAEVVEVPNGD